MGNALIVIPEHDCWQPLLESLPLFSEDFMAERMQPPPPMDENAVE
jgi:antitoxin VapB